MVVWDFTVPAINKKISGIMYFFMMLFFFNYCLGESRTMIQPVIGEMPSA